MVWQTYDYLFGEFNRDRDPFDWWFDFFYGRRDIPRGPFYERPPREGGGGGGGGGTRPPPGPVVEPPRTPREKLQLQPNHPRSVDAPGAGCPKSDDPFIVNVPDPFHPGRCVGADILGGIILGLPTAGVFRGVFTAILKRQSGAIVKAAARVLRGPTRRIRPPGTPAIPRRVVPRPPRPNPARPFPARPARPTTVPRPSRTPPPYRIPRAVPLPIERGPVPGTARPPQSAPHPTPQSAPTGPSAPAAPAPPGAPVTAPTTTEPAQAQPSPQPATAPSPTATPSPTSSPSPFPSPVPTTWPFPSPFPSPVPTTWPSSWPTAWPFALPALRAAPRTAYRLPGVNRITRDLTDLQRPALDFAPKQSVDQDRCTDTQRKKKRRQQRTTCHRGTYRETARGLNKSPKETIYCRK